MISTFLRHKHNFSLKNTKPHEVFLWQGNWEKFGWEKCLEIFQTYVVMKDIKTTQNAQDLARNAKRKEIFPRISIN